MRKAVNQTMAKKSAVNDGVDNASQTQELERTNNLPKGAKRPKNTPK